MTTLQENFDRVQAWLKEKNIKCPACGHSEVKFDDVVAAFKATPMEFGDEPPVLPQRRRHRTEPAKEVIAIYGTGAGGDNPALVAFAKVSCSSCHYALLFDADSLGLDVR